VCFALMKRVPDRLIANWATAGTSTTLGSEIWNPATMPALPRWTLKVVPAPLIEGVPKAPPVLETTPNPTVEGKCGKCGAVLMRGDEGKVYPLMVHCIACGAYNSTDA
jgi:hypothetical protein